jgi:hypothetical protein
MMLAGLQALQADLATEVIVLISKPPAAAVANKMLEQAAAGSKPSVVCFLGGDLEEVRGYANVYPARTLQEAALLAARLVKGEPAGGIEAQLAAEDQRLAEQANGLRAGLAPSQKYLRGLYSGGTLCYEAQVIWRDWIPETVRSNAPLRPQDSRADYSLADSTRSQGHSAVDLGEEEFTVGRPHPMIDNDLRIRRLLQEAQDPETAIILLDVVIGYGAHPDPASELGPAVVKARSLAQSAGRTLPVVAAITGTPGDPQGLERQRDALESAGVVVCGSNAAAARLAAHLVCPDQGSR